MWNHTSLNISTLKIYFKSHINTCFCQLKETISRMCFSVCVLFTSFRRKMEEEEITVLLFVCLQCCPSLAKVSGVPTHKRSKETDLLRIEKLCSQRKNQLLIINILKSMKNGLRWKTYKSLKSDFLWTL